MKKSDRFWEMREGGPYDGEGGRQVFKCVGCGAVSRPKAGWNGEPEGHVCGPGCSCAGGDLNVVASNVFRRNFDTIFPTAPGAGL